MFSLEFLYDMSYCGFTAKDEYRLTFLKEVTPLLEHAGTAANLTLYNWLELALHAIQGHTPEGVIQGRAYQAGRFYKLIQAKNITPSNHILCIFLQG